MAQVATSIGHAGDAAMEYAAQAAQSARQAYDQISERTREGYARTEAVVQRYPTQSVAVAFGAGVFAGVMIGLWLQANSY